jgi:hypothetical protein
MMGCDFERVFGTLADAMPTSSDGNAEFVFSRRTLPVPPAEMATDRLILAKTTHSYHPAWRVDAVRMQAHRRTCRQLGLLILAVVFHETPAQVHVALTHPSSSVTHLVLEYTYLDESRGGYRTRPYTFVYSPRETARHPWYGRPESWPRRDLRDLPVFALTTMDDLIMTSEDWTRRDTVRGCGSDEARVLFAELLLDAGRPGNLVTEYHLEGEGGFRGVGEQSAEMSIFLPGSPGWTDDL